MESRIGFNPPAKPSVAELLQQWMDRDLLPRLVVDEEMHILWSNREAGIQLGQRRDLETREGILCATNPAHQSMLEEFVANSGPTISTISLPCEDGDGHLLFRGVELGAGPRPRYFGLTFFRSGSEFAVRYADLERVFHLTRAEHVVLLELLAGNTADEIATKLKVSIETTRSHIRQIYSKLDVTSREGLFSRVRPYRV
jgi:DNA-binding CsgD family transcriptional regulator